MKSLNRRFAEWQEKRPNHGSIINFQAAIRGGKFTPRVVAHWFNRLVDKDDFAKAEKRDIFKWLNSLSGAEDGRKQPIFPAATAPKSATPVSVLTNFTYVKTTA